MGTTVTAVGAGGEEAAEGIAGEVEEAVEVGGGTMTTVGDLIAGIASTTTTITTITAAVGHQEEEEGGLITTTTTVDTTDGVQGRVRVRVRTEAGMAAGLTTAALAPGTMARPHLHLHQSH